MLKFYHISYLPLSWKGKSILWWSYDCHPHGYKSFSMWSRCYPRRSIWSQDIYPL